MLSRIDGVTREPRVLGEFVCWYHHVAYAAAVTSLIDSGHIVSPSGECIAVIWYCLNPKEGLMIE